MAGETPVQDDILNSLRHPPCSGIATVAQLRVETGRPYWSIREALNRLRRKGLVLKRAEDRPIRYVITPLGLLVEEGVL